VIAAAVADVPHGSTVVLLNLPRQIRCEACVGPNYILEGHSVSSWLALGGFRQDLKVNSLSAVVLDDGQEPPRSSAIEEGDGLMATIGAGTLEPPWMASNVGLQAEFQAANPARWVRIRKSGTAEGAVFLDLLGETRVFRPRFLQGTR
jgi:hypothetical protein